MFPPATENYHGQGEVGIDIVIIFGKTTCKDFKRTGDYLYSIVSKSLKSNLIVLSYHTLEFRNPIKEEFNTN